MAHRAPDGDAVTTVLTRNALRTRTAWLSRLNIPLFRNASALVVSGVVTTMLGLAFWALAARWYPPAEVGRASSAISAMTFFVTLFQFSLNNGLIRFLPDAGGRGRRLLLQAYLVTTITTALGAIAVVVAFSGHTFLADLGRDAFAFAALFTVSLPLWSLFVMQDAALIGLRAAVYVPAENLAFAVAKLGFLVVLAGWPTGGLLAAWILPAGLLIPPVTWLIFHKLLPRTAALPSRVSRWSQVRGYLAADFSGSFLETLAAAAVPIVVTWRLGLTEGAYFYTSWIALVGIDLVLHSVGYSLIVEGAHTRSALPQLYRLAAKVTAGIVAVTVPIGMAAAPLFLSVIGADYAAHGTTLFRLLIIAVPFRAYVVLHLGAARVEQRGGTIAAYQATYAVLLVAGAWYGLPRVGIEAIGGSFLCAQLTLATCAFCERRWRSATPERQ